MITFKQFYEAAVTPKGNYMSINVDGSMVLPGFVKPKTGTEIPLDKQHVTLIYSQTSELDPGELLSKIESLFPHEIPAQVYEFASFDALPKDGTRDATEATLVVKLKSDMLNKIHEKLKELGCEHSYPEYSAHVSLYYGVNKKECDLLVKLNNRIVKLPSDIRLAGYKSEPIIEDWGKDLK